MDRSKQQNVTFETVRCAACGAEIGESFVSTGHLRLDSITSGRCGTVPVAVIARFCSMDCELSIESDGMGCFGNWQPSDGLQVDGEREHLVKVAS